MSFFINKAIDIDIWKYSNKTTQHTIIMEYKILSLGNKKKNRFSFCISLVYS